MRSWRDDPTEARKQLREYRSAVDALDRVLVDVLAHRSRIVRYIGELKALHGWPLRDPARESLMMDRYRRDGLNYSDETMRRIFQALFEASEECQ